MAVAQTGTALLVGVGTTLDGFIIKSITRGGAEVAMTDVTDEDGALLTRVVKQVMDKVELTLVVLDGSDPTSTFPIGSYATGAWAGYYVQDCSFTRTEDPAEVSVSLIEDGLGTQA